MYQVVVETKNLWDSVPRTCELPDTAKESFMKVLETAQEMAKDHAGRVAQRAPFRLGNGFRFLAGASTSVTYEAREVTK